MKMLSGLGATKRWKTYEEYIAGRRLGACPPIPRVLYDTRRVAEDGWCAGRYNDPAAISELAISLGVDPALALQQAGLAAPPSNGGGSNMVLYGIGALAILGVGYYAFMRK